MIALPLVPHRSTLALLLLGAFLLLAPSKEVSALVGASGKVVPAIARIAANPRALTDDEIVRLSKLAGEVRGTARLGDELGKLNLPGDVLEDIFLRIAVHQGRLPRVEAERLFRNLTGVPGFSTTLRKTIGHSEVGTAGHLYELRLASEAVERGFEVRAIGQKFVDGFKRGPSDIDVILERRGRVVAIEAKHYGSRTRMPLDMYRADLDTLVAFRESERRNVLAVFSIANKPENQAYLRMLKHEAARRDVELLFGDAGSSITQIRQLLDTK